jgi:hypothetical protein
LTPPSLRAKARNMKYHFAGLAVGLLGTALIAPTLAAQGRGGTFFTPPARTGGTFFNAPTSNGFQPFPGPIRFHGRFPRGSHRHHFSRYYAPYYSGYGPYFYSPDYDYDDGAAEEPPPAARSAPPAATPESHKAADSVVMELRGDHWVRLTTTGPVEVFQQGSSPADRPAVFPAFDQSPAAAPLPAAVFVFRDGHQEEATSYTIVGRTIYLKADYWSTGSQSPSWTRKISTADLDIPATLKLNSERGTKFALPSRPSEVILRP